ncbi:MAG: class I SAM-dependent methyltransferase [Sphingomonadales bacterium]|nr:class I SAM-dependent methyltransferase [Sphingomonadales bacterium]
MNPAAYVEMAETESRHWWFTGRRCIISSIIMRLKLPQNPHILEVGCGTGGNLDMLGKFGTLSALEMDESARAIAVMKTENRYDIRAGSCPNDIPFTEKAFDLICMFDVLEHIEQDSETLSVIKNLLGENGRLIITVPAYQWLYGAHDEFLHHKRRYTAKQLRCKCAAAGLNPTRISYFNTILFPIAAMVRIKDKWLGNSSASGTRTPPSIINMILHKLFGFERFLLQRCNLPFGVSLLCIVESADES